MKGIWIRYYVEHKRPVMDYREFRDSEELIAWYRLSKKLGNKIIITEIGNEEDLP